MDDQTLRAQLEEATQRGEELRGELASLRHDHEALLDATRNLVNERDQLRRRNEELEAANKRLTDMLWSRRSERRADGRGQARLPFLDDAEEAPAEVAGEIIAGEIAPTKLDPELLRKKPQKPRPAKRRSEELPAHLERRERLIDLTEAEKEGLKYIGDAVNERMRFEKPRTYVERIVRRKYIVPNEPERGVLAPPAPLAIVEGCKYGFDVVAAMITLKFAFHQPTYRQQDWFAQCGWFPSRSTINEILNLGADVLEPLDAQMTAELVRSRVLLADETPLLLLTRGALTDEQRDELRRRKKARGREEEGRRDDGGAVTSYAWLVNGLDGEAPYNVFHWTLARRQTSLDELLTPFRGTLVADAHDAYAHVEDRTEGRILHASCNAHARREFVRAESYQPILCAEILSLYRQLYDIEDRGQALPIESRQQLRQREAKPIWERIDRWLASPTVARAALPRSPFGKAVGYLRNQGPALRRYLEDGRVPFDNNQSERFIRPLAVGRRNWMFLGHPAAAPRRMRLLGVVSSAHRHDLIVENYLADVLEKLADARQHHPARLEPDSPFLKELLPDRWAAAHPESVRRQRADEKRDRAEATRARRAERRQSA